MKTGKELLETLKSRVVVGDGAFGTRLYEKGVKPGLCYDYLNIENPSLVAVIHNEYLAVGSELIETNTFGANRIKLGKFGIADKVYEINKTGAEIAASCAQNAWIAGSMGPLGRLEDEISDKEKFEIFKEQAQGLADGGVDIFIMETFNSLADLKIALSAVKSVKEDATTITQLVLTPVGKTVAGDEALIAFLELKKAGADIVGANCGVGPSGILKVMRDAASKIEGVVSAFPNASFPEITEDRMISRSDSYYIAETAVNLVKSGVSLIGGCCETTPEDIKAIKEAVSGMSPGSKKPVSLEEAIAEKEKRALSAYAISEGELKSKMLEKKVIIVELDPPKGLDYERVVQGAAMLKEAGVDCISIAENPLALVRMSNVTLANLIQREVGIETIVHVTGRDRNLIGMQSALMGMAVDGIKNVLAITGDPPVKGREDRVKGVFDVRSYDIISLLSRLNKGENYFGEDIKKRTAFNIGGAFNPNTQDMRVQVERMKRKIEEGAAFFQTQPVYSKQKVDEILEATKDINIPIFLGVLPLVSSRNAEFLHNEFPGITIDEDIRKRMREAGENGASEGMAASWEIIEYAYKHFAGIYIMPPFNRYEIALNLVKQMKSLS